MALVSTPKPINPYQLGQEIGGSPPLHVVGPDTSGLTTVALSSVSQQDLEAAIAAHEADFSVVAAITNRASVDLSDVDHTGQVAADDRLAEVIAQADDDGVDIWFGPGTIRLDQMLVVDKPVAIHGAGKSYHSHATTLQFPADTPGILMASQGASLSGVVVRGLIGSASAGSATGIEIRRPCVIEHVGVQAFNGHGIHINGGDGNNANTVTLRDVRTDVNRVDGIHINGGDGNACLIEHANSTGNGRWGICDESFLGNSYLSAHTSSNGVEFHLTQPIMSWASGSATLTASSDTFDSTWVGSLVLTGSSNGKIGFLDGIPTGAYIGAVASPTQATIHVGGSPANFTRTRTARTVAHTEKQYPAMGTARGKVYPDAVLTSGSTTVTSASASFTQDHRGMGVETLGSTGIDALSHGSEHAYISEVVDANTVEINRPATSTGTATVLVGGGGPFRAVNTTQFSGVWVAMYSEGGQMPSMLGGMNTIIGGDHGAGFRPGLVGGGPAWLTTSQGKFVIPTTLSVVDDVKPVSRTVTLGPLSENSPVLMEHISSQQLASNGGSGRGVQLVYDDVTQMWWWSAGNSGLLPHAYAIATRDNTRGMGEGMLAFPNGHYTGTGTPTGSPSYTTLVYEGAGTAAPATGTWKRGDRILNTVPAAGGFVGWVCVTAGTPGTWKGYGSIEA